MLRARKGFKQMARSASEARKQKNRTIKLVDKIINIAFKKIEEEML